MKSILILLFAVTYSLHSSAQQCNYLGCAANFGVRNATNQSRVSTSNLGCISQSRQVFWQFVFSPGGGNYSQSFTPSGTQDLDWVIFDIGTTPTAQQSCPVTSTGWTQLACNYGSTSGATGPGIDGTATTVAGHYYAIAVSVYSNSNFTFTIGTPLINGSALTALNCPAGGPLPLKLTLFESVLNTDNTYLLTWKTESEINTSYFEIVASYDNQIWGPLDSVAAKNNGGTNLYSFASKNMVKGILYVKLKMIDKDGRFTFSPVIVLRSKQKNLQVVSTGANPASNTLNYIVYAYKPISANFCIIDATGRKLKAVKINLAENNNSVSIVINQLQSGIYFLQITDVSGETNILTRFVKK